MHISPEKIQELALKWLQGDATAEEEKQLFGWYNDNQGSDTFVNEPFFNKETELRERMLANIAASEDGPFIKGNMVPFWRATWFRVAASVLIVLGAAGAWFLAAERHRQDAQVAAVITRLNAASPGADRALLTLADGSKVLLDDAVNGSIGRQAQVDIIKKDGKVSYVGTGDAETIMYNTISTPRKGQYHLVLADGTGVWLDAESSIRFPVSFTGADRTVDISGQVYFEVAKNTERPFHVKVALKEIDINVLGTHFNIMAYENETTVKTTLLEGAVKVNTAGNAVLLEPGQQAAIRQTGNIRLVEAANLDQVMAWKNGMFNLGSTPIEEIMRQIARWYDKEIVYEGDVSKLKFSGEISRKKDLPELLRMLEATGTIQFIQDDQKITVISKK